MQHFAATLLQLFCAISLFVSRNRLFSAKSKPNVHDWRDISASRMREVKNRGIGGNPGGCQGEK
jgi:hypothetical protein